MIQIHVDAVLLPTPLQHLQQPLCWPQDPWWDSNQSIWSMPALTSVTGTPSWLTRPTFKRTITAMLWVEWQNSKENELEDVSLATVCSSVPTSPTLQHHTSNWKKYRLKPLPLKWQVKPGRDTAFSGHTGQYPTHNTALHLMWKTTLDKEQQQPWIEVQGAEQPQELALKTKKA